MLTTDPDTDIVAVISSLTIANHMLSLHGSLLADPFKEPPPTFDRSYLRKSLLPSEALGLGSAPGPQQAAETDEATPIRRVRWQDEDSRSSDIDDFSDTQTAVTKIPGIKAGRDASKRKSKSGEADEASTPSKKRRKES